MPRPVDSEADTEEENEQNFRDYSDYYEAVAESKTIRPICVSEGVDFNILSTCDTICWWFKASLQMLRC